MKQETEKKRPNIWGDDWDGEYMGNIWGWKFSLFGFVLIIIMVGFLAYAHNAGLVNIYTGESPQPTTKQVDSLKHE